MHRLLGAVPQLLVVRPNHHAVEMHTRAKTIAVVGAVHLALYWGILGILRISGFQLFSFGSLLGFAPPPRHSPVQEFLFVFAGLLTYPLVLLPDLPWIPDHWLSVFAGFIVNSAIWGVCFTYLFYAVKGRLGKHAA